MVGLQASFPERGTGPNASGRLEPPGSDAAGAAWRCDLDQARSYLAAVADALSGWAARRTIPGHTYAQDGHDAIRHLNMTTRVLYKLRATLVGELRADEDERAARVDRLLADLRAGRTARIAPQPDGGVPGRDGGAG